MKSVQDLAPRSEPTGRLVNRPVAVDDDLRSIIQAMGGDPKWADRVSAPVMKSNIPVAEY